MKPRLTRRAVMTARGIAIAADILQWIALPLMFTGVTRVTDGVVDVIVCVALLRLVGWHLAFLPSFIAELLPFVDLVPMWTVAVFFATRNWKDRLPEVGSGSPPGAPQRPGELPAPAAQIDAGPGSHTPGPPAT